MDETFGKSATGSTLQWESGDTAEQSAQKKPREIRTEELVKIYSKRRVVDGASITVHQGEIVGLLGR